MEVKSQANGDAPLSPPTNPMVSPLLTDMYQISMAYAYWKAGKHNDSAVYASIRLSSYITLGFELHHSFSSKNLESLFILIATNAMLDYSKYNCSSLQVFEILVVFWVRGLQFVRHLRNRAFFCSILDSYTLDHIIHHMSSFHFAKVHAVETNPD